MKIIKTNYAKEIVDVLKEMLRQYKLQYMKLPESICVSENIYYYIQRYQPYSFEINYLSEITFMGIKVYRVIEYGIINVGGIMQKVEVEE